SERAQPVAEGAVLLDVGVVGLQRLSVVAQAFLCFPGAQGLGQAGLHRPREQLLVDDDVRGFSALADGGCARRHGRGPLCVDMRILYAHILCRAIDWGETCSDPDQTVERRAMSSAAARSGPRNRATISRSSITSMSHTQLRQASTRLPWRTGTAIAET